MIDDDEEEELEKNELGRENWRLNDEVPVVVVLREHVSRRWNCNVKSDMVFELEAAKLRRVEYWHEMQYCCHGKETSNDPAYGNGQCLLWKFFATPFWR